MHVFCTSISCIWVGCSRVTRELDMVHIRRCPEKEGLSHEQTHLSSLEYKLPTSLPCKQRAGAQICYHALPFLRGSQLGAYTLSTECTHTLNWVHTHFQLNAHTLSTAIICHNYYQLMSRRLSQFHAYTPVYTCSENRLPAGPLLWRINKQRLNWITKLSNECTTIVGLKAHFCRRWSILCSDAVTGPT